MLPLYFHTKFPDGPSSKSIGIYRFVYSLVDYLQSWIKKVYDCERQTPILSELKDKRLVQPDLIHTSCRSESSNISLVVLDNLVAARF